MSEGTVRLKPEYTWPAPNPEKMLQQIRGTILDFMGDQIRIYGEVEEPGDIPIQHKFNSLDECETLLSLKLESLYINISARESSRYFNLTSTQSLKYLRIDFEVDSDQLTEASLLLQALEQGLGLKILTDLRGNRLEFVRTEKRYLFNPEQKQIFFDLISWLETQFQNGMDRVNATYSLPDRQLSLGDFQRWKVELAQNWTMVKEAYLNLDALDIRVYISLRKENEELKIEIEKPDPLEIQNLYDAMEKKFNLEKLLEDFDQKLIGETRQYFTHDSLDLDWIKQLVGFLKKQFKRNNYFAGRYTLKTSSTQTAQRMDLQVWQDEVQQYWPTISKASIWLDQRSRRLDLNMDPLRHWIVITVEAKDQNTVDELFHELELELKLDLSKEDPYRFRRSSGIYKIKAWRSLNFSEAINTAIQLFVGEKYALVDAIVELGLDKNGELQAFTSVPEFLNRAADPSPYVHAEIYLEGPRGMALGISAFDNLQRLSIRSSLDPKEFSQLEDLFKKKINIKKVSQAEAEGEKSEENAKPKQPYLDVLKIVIPIILTFLLSSLFWANIFPKESLKITVPQLMDKQAIIVQTRQVPVEWVLEREQWFQKKIERSSPAEVRVLKDGLTPIIDLYNQRPGGVMLNLDPGLYDIEVISASSNYSDKIRIEVKLP